MVLKHLILLLLLQKCVYRVVHYSLVRKCASRTAHIGREGEIKILNFKIEIFSKKSGNQSTTVGLNKVEPKYACKN